MDVLGIIFSDIQNKESFEVTTDRTIASVPIGGRYRLIDFILSQFSNAGIKNVGVVTKNNYQSLMGHVGAGKEWDMDRKKGGLVILPPYSVNTESYNTRLNAVKGIMPFINHSRDEYVILTDCYHISNIDYQDVIDFHIQKNADITCVCHKDFVNTDSYFPVSKISVDETYRITNFEFLNDCCGECYVSLDTWIMKREFLQEIIREALCTNYDSFNRDVLQKNVNNYKIYSYDYKGYYGNVYDLNSYFKVSMDLLNEDVRSEIFYTPGRPVYTKVRDSAPTKYGRYAKVENSIIADGCVIEGEVYDSVLFRGTKIAKGCIVKNCILYQDTDVSGNVNIEYVITDKKARIESKNELKGSPNNLIYVKKGGVL